MREPLLSQDAEGRFARNVLLVLILVCGTFFVAYEFDFTDSEIPVGGKYLTQKSSLSCGVNLEIGTPIFCSSGRIDSHSQDTYPCRPRETLSRSACCLCEKATKSGGEFQVSLPQILGLTAGMCGLVSAGQPSCVLSCAHRPQHELQCTSIDSDCPRNAVMERMDAKQRKCCTCEPITRLRGGLLRHSPIRMTTTPFIPRDSAPFWGPEIWTLAKRGNNPEWYLDEMHGGPVITRQAWDKYKLRFNQLTNNEFMQASENASPFDVAHFVELGAPIEDVENREVIRMSLLRGWFAGNPTKVFAAGPQARGSSISEIKKDSEGLIVISQGKSSSIRQILDQSWWGKDWNNYPAGEGIFPTLLIFVHQDEANAYLKALIDYPKNIYIVSHAAAGYGPVRNKALGILKEKSFASGVIIEDDCDFIDSSGIIENTGSNEPVQNTLQVIMDVLSGNPFRARKWKGEIYGEFGMLDFIAPLESLNRPIGDISELGEREDSLESRSQLTNNPMWKRFKPFIGMSRSAYRIAYFENALFWGDPDNLFIQRMLGSAEDYLLRYALLEMRVGRKKFSPQVTQPIAGGLEELYWNFMMKEVSKSECTLDALKDGAFGMISGDEELSSPEVTYGALAIYQWTILNVNQEADESGSVSWLVFNGLYNSRYPISWAINFINKLQDGKFKSDHPFKDVFPAKLMSLYVERNIVEIVEPPWGGSAVFDKLTAERSREMYFEDKFPITAIPSSFLKELSSLDEAEPEF